MYLHLFIYLFLAEFYIFIYLLKLTRETKGATTLQPHDYSICSRAPAFQRGNVFSFFFSFLLIYFVRNWIIFVRKKKWLDNY